MLEDKGVAFRYREYTRERLTPPEIERLLQLLGLEPEDVLRKSDKAYTAAGLTGSETAAELVELMAQHPTLLQRPIAVLGDKAVLCRPVDNLLELIT